MFRVSLLFPPSFLDKAWGCVTSCNDLVCIMFVIGSITTYMTYMYSILGSMSSEDSEVLHICISTARFAPDSPCNVLAPSLSTIVTSTKSQFLDWSLSHWIIMRKNPNCLVSRSLFFSLNTRNIVSIYSFKKNLFFP